MEFRNELEDNSLLKLLKPIIRVNQFVGVCPHEISGSMMIFRWKSFKLFHTIFTLLILSLYFVFMLFQFIMSFSRGRKTPEMVALAVWLGGTLVPIAMLLVIIQKRNQITLFFEKMYDYKVPLKGMVECGKAIRYSRKLYGFYIFLCLLSCIFVTCQTIVKPKADMSILAYLECDEPSTTMVFLACAFQCYLVIVKSCASAFIEVLCSSLAISFVNTTIRIKKELQKSLDGSPRCQRPFGLNSDPENRMGIRRHSCINGGNKKEMNNHPHIQKVKEHHHNQGLNVGELYPVIPIVDSSGQNGELGFSLKPYPNHSMDGYGNVYSECVTESTGPILLAIKRYNCIANMQRLINCIFGLILALDTGLLVFMSCLLLYLQINYLGSSYVDKIDGMIFSGNSICFFVRLVIIFISLGNVHDISLCFNGVLTSSLMQVKKPKPMDVNLILAHLSTHSAHPVSYSAGGFFIFSKSSLLAVLSVIMTYLVFLLQAR